MLSYKQYKILKLIDKYQKEKSIDKNSYKHKSQILLDDFWKKTKYKKYSVETILSKLCTDGYIKDTTQEIITDIHAVTITNEGYDALDNYIKSKITNGMFFIFGGIVTFILDHIFDIISLVSTLSSNKWHKKVSNWMTYNIRDNS